MIANRFAGLRVWLARLGVLALVCSPSISVAVDDCVDTRPLPVFDGGTNGVTSVFAADMNGDGNPDVLSASSNDDKIAWYENDGESPPGFIEHVVSTEADGASAVHAADLNGDGLTDVISASANDDKISWYQNIGGSPPRFLERIILTDAQGVVSIHVADVDGDEDLDILSASSVDSKIEICLNNLNDPDRDDGPLKFTEVVVTFSAFGASSVFAADLDGDGFDDILSASRFDDEIAWHRPTVAGVFEPLCDDLTTECDSVDDCPGEEDACFVRLESFTITNSADGASSVFAVDLDGDDDGDIDVLSASANDGEIAWYEAEITTDKDETTVSFVKRIIASDADGANSVYAADLDGDLDMDVLSASRLDNTIAWYEQDSEQSPPTFTKHVITADAEGANRVLAVQLDNKGDTDFDVIASWSVAGPVASADRIAWFENDDKIPGTFVERIVAGSAVVPRVLLVADMDGEGGIDVLVASSSDDKIAWLENDGAEDPAFTERVVTLDADDPASLFLADVDGEGNTDIVAALGGPNAQIVWYENLGFLCDDLLTECDGDEDCAMGGGGACYPRYEIHTVSTNVEAPKSVFAIDLDQDKSGDVDILVASSEDDKIAWHENTGGFPPGFVEHVISTTANGASSVFAIDLDQDVDIDVLSASANDDKIAWYENLGGSPPEFEEHLLALNANGARSVLAADIDQDDDLDVVSGSSFDDRIAWYENIGRLCDDLETECESAVTCDPPDPDNTEIEATCELRFLQRSISFAADFVRGVITADIENDGDLDILSVSSGDDSILWYENLGDVCSDGETPCETDEDCGDDAGTCDFRFDTHGVTTSSDGAMAMAVGDINGDETLDVLSGFLFGINWHAGDAEERCTNFDGDGDERIDGVEVIWVGMAFGDACLDPEAPEAEWWAPVDVNDDCFIDGEDLAILTSNGVWATYVVEDPKDETRVLCSFSCQ